MAASALLYLLAGILAIRSRQSGAVFFLTGAAAVVGSIIFAVVTVTNPGMIALQTSGNGGRYALLVEGLAFALTILVRIQAVRMERDAALRREIAVSQDKLAALTALRDAEEDHRRALALAEQRRQQLASAAHDIQQPIAALRLTLQRIEKDGGLESSRLKTSFDYLSKLISRNLEETRPESHCVPDRSSARDASDPEGREAEELSEAFPVSAVLENVRMMFVAEAEQKSLRIDLVASTVRIIAEPVSLMRIISNLVSNAVKYTQHGRILIGCRRKPDVLWIEIHDTGPGLSQDELERVIQPYARGHEDGDGTGLGLSVVARLAEAHGFRFRISSSPGRGSVFRVAVPLASSL